MLDSGLAHLLFCDPNVPTEETCADNGAIPPNDQIRDTATLDAPASTTGTITFKAYSDSDCTNLVFTSTAISVNGTYSSDPTPNDASDDFAFRPAQARTTGQRSTAVTTAILPYQPRVVSPTSGA